MQKVITINLNGRAFQLDENAYELLRAYLDRARDTLRDNPDLTEIMADLEQAIGEKCQKFLSPHKSVIEAAEVKQVIAEMGPVDNAPSGTTSTAEASAGASSSSTDAPHAEAPRRLYQIRQGAWVSGVCTGIAAYFNIDVMVIRVIFVVLTLATKGTVGVAVYLFLMFVLPHASTSEEHAAAHGTPLNAKEIIDQAASAARTFADEAVKDSRTFYRDWTGKHRDFRREWRRERREWRQQWRDSRRRRRTWWSPPTPSAAPVVATSYGAHIAAGVMVPLLAIAGVALFWFWVASILSLLSTGALFGRPLPDDLPLWAGLLVAVLIYNAVAWPLHAVRRAAYQTLGSTNFMSVGAWDGMMSFGFSILAFWFAYQYIPEVHDFLRNWPTVEENFRQMFRTVPR